MGRKKSPTKQEKAFQRRIKKSRQKDRQRGGDEDDGDVTEMRIQLEKLGLTLKEISGDGNCLFRALADQLYGNNKAIGGYHMKLRREVVEYIRQHREDFEPFVDEDVTFDRHVELLEQDGTYAGQDAIVAFARLHGVTIVIHQLNEPLWQIHGSPDGQSRCAKELHISYHNGDHYNSVRRLGDLESNEPANLKIDIIQPTASGHHSDSDDNQDDEDEEEVLSDYENTPNRMDLDRMANEVRVQTGSHDLRSIYESLEQNGYNVKVAVAKILEQKSASEKGRHGSESRIWSQGGTGNRIFGDAVSQVATASASKKSQPQVPRKGHNNSPKSKKETTDFRKKRERRSRDGDNAQDSAVVTLVPTLQTLSL